MRVAYLSDGKESVSGKARIVFAPDTMDVDFLGQATWKIVDRNLEERLTDFQVMGAYANGQALAGSDLTALSDEMRRMINFGDSTRIEELTKSSLRLSNGGDLITCTR